MKTGDLAWYAPFDVCSTPRKVVLEVVHSNGFIARYADGRTFCHRSDLYEDESSAWLGLFNQFDELAKRCLNNAERACDGLESKCDSGV